MRPHLYRLRGQEPEPCYSTIEWARWRETTRGIHVGDTTIGDDGQAGQGIRISTVFLGVDHCFTDHGPPILFETMVFGPEVPTQLFNRVQVMRNESDIGGCRRYCTWAEAAAGHEEMVTFVRSAMAEMELEAARAISKATATSAF